MENLLNMNIGGCKTIRLILLLIITIPLFSQGKENKNKPNIIFIMSDDMGYETVGYNGARNYKTPNIDKLAREGVVFTNCDAQPLCVPTRVKLVTGQYNYRNYIGWGSFNLEFPAIGKLMQTAGYATGAFGKWHLGKSPDELGFDEHCYFDGSPKGLKYSDFFKRYNYNSVLVEDGRPIVADYAPDKFNDRVLKFIDDHGNGEKPFFIYYPLTLAHNPFEPTPDSRDSSSKSWQRNFEDMVAYSDKMIGRVIDKLKKEGLYDNTVIFYTSDNGTKVLEHEMENGDTIYGGKGTLAVDGCHVPLFVKYKGSHKVVDDLVDFSDFYPTLASIAGVSKNNLSDRMDGVSLLPVLEGGERNEKRFIFSIFKHPLGAYIRDKQYKFYMDGRFYNIENDLRELQPLYTCNGTPETAKRRKKLQAQLSNLLEDEQLATYKTKELLLNKFEGYQTERKDSYLLRSYLFHQLEYTPRTEKISYDISNYLSAKTGGYSVRFKRGMGISNAGLAYADVMVKSVKIVNEEGDIIFEKKCEGMELTTRRDIEMLRKKGNPLIAFTRTGDDSKIPLGDIIRPSEGITILEVEVEVCNPGNQWGDRLQLSLYLDKEKK